MREYLRKNPEQAEKNRSRARDWRKNNQERAAARDARYWQENKNKIREYFKRWFAANKEKASESCSRWAKENPEKARAAAKVWYKQNKGAVIARAAEWRKNNKKKSNACVRAWKQKNLERHAAGEARRRARKLVPIDVSANPSLISVFYEIAKRVSQCLGIEHHVDHVVPLSKGGVHHQLNLQVIPWILNLRKGVAI